ncbi:hypothetical protein Moror_13935 [Moniliophthora roreri MCA 2997]|uniref:DUF6534 domain-containing protein n=1 Tax=Moniliophthora roreri (strain MCA 2997) TaxID=1381753 RepID=V2XR71_MONRO|nr:hypothetical protein Moror_13935 [Moniliophthora roreri MCA 2997]
MDESFTPIDTTYGSAFLGLVISAILYGITILQVYFYYRNYPRDARFIKILVFTVWYDMKDTALRLRLTLTLGYGTLYISPCVRPLSTGEEYLITNYARPDALEQLTWSMEVAPDRLQWHNRTDCSMFLRPTIMDNVQQPISGVGYCDTIVYTFRTWNRVHDTEVREDDALQREKDLTAIYNYSFALVTTANFQKLIWVTSAGIGSAAAADIMIAASLCYYLSRSKTGFRRTDSLITILIIYTVTTGLMTSVIDFAIIITFALMPNNYVWLALFWVVGRCYVNSFLAALNCRDSLREKAATRDPASFMHLTPITGSVASDRRSLYGGVPPLAVTIHTATVQKTDYLDSPESISTAPAALA